MERGGGGGYREARAQPPTRERLWSTGTSAKKVKDPSHRRLHVLSHAIYITPRTTISAPTSWERPSLREVTLILATNAAIYLNLSNRYYGSLLRSPPPHPNLCKPQHQRAEMRGEAGTARCAAYVPEQTRSAEARGPSPARQRPRRETTVSKHARAFGRGIVSEKRVGRRGGGVVGDGGGGRLGG